MSTRRRMLLGGVCGFLWAVCTVWVGAAVLNIPIFALQATLYLAFLGTGLVTGLMIFAVAVSRFRNDALASGNAPMAGSSADINIRVLKNTVEQLVLALALWPAIGFLAATDGPGLLSALGLSFATSRLVYWLGYRISPALRLFGWSATFYANFIALAWAIGIWLR